MSDAIRWEEHPLIPAIVQHPDTLQVLMLGFMNAEAYHLTRETGRVHFFSRSRNKLWRKGETSGHELVVDEIRINCEENSLLVLALPLGPTCHEGYATCYFRRVDDVGGLATVLDRLQEPEAIYGTGPSLEARTRRWYRAYEHLRDTDLGAQSGTSRRLRDPQAQIADRLADELRELAGVLDGTHVHDGLEADLLLEGSQTLYWCVLIAVRAEVPFAVLRPDRALVAGPEHLSAGIAASLLAVEAHNWQDRVETGDLAARCHATIALIAQACAAAGVDPGRLIDRDLAELATKPYLAALFAAS